MRVLTKTGAKLKARGMIYKAVAQKVLLYGSKIWVVTGAMLKILEGFQYWEARRITGMASTYVVDRKWEYPPMVA